MAEANWTTDGQFRTRSGALIDVRNSIAIVAGVEYAFNQAGNVSHLNSDGSIMPVKAKEHEMDLMERIMMKG